MNADAPASSDLTDAKGRLVEGSIAEESLPKSQFNPKRLSLRIWWLIPTVLVPLAVLGTRQLSPSYGVEPEPELLSVTVVSPQQVGAYAVEREYAGEIVAGRSSNLGFELGGTVVELLVDEGDVVSAGQPLARLDTRSLAVQRQQLIAQRDQAAAGLRELQNGPRSQDIAAAQAAVADLEQQVALAKLQRDRRSDLYNRGAISREELDQQTFGTGSLENRLAQAQSELNELLSGTRPEQVDAQSAQVRQLDASIQAIDIDLSKSVITAPFSGRVSQRPVDEGVVVSGGQPILELVEGSALEARIGVPADIVDGLVVGSSQTIEVGGQTYPATVAAQLPELESTSRTVTIVLKMNTDAELTIGQTARLTIADTQSASGFWVPSTALVQGEKGLWSVYVAEESEAEPTKFEVARRPIEIVHTEGDRVLVNGLLQPSDQLIPSGTHRIVPGQAISVIAEET